jgi:hypothetical protein
MIDECEQEMQYVLENSTQRNVKKVKNNRHVHPSALATIKKPNDMNAKASIASIITMEAQQNMDKSYYGPSSKGATNDLLEVEKRPSDMSICPPFSESPLSKILGLYE